MTAETFRIGFLPLVDAALPILARELGFAEAEAVEIELVRDVTWAAVRDRLLYGHTDAAHLVAPLAISTALGRDRPAVPMAVPFALGLNGNAITFSTALGEAVGLGETLGDPVAIGAALKAVADRRRDAGRPLRFGVVHRYSSHNYMLRYWLAGVGIRPDADVEILVTSPPFAADALAAGEVDGICVGEPWNSIAVDRGVGRIALATAQIWRRGVEKVLALRGDRAEERRDGVLRLIRALHAAAAHFVDPETVEQSATILSRREYLDAPVDAVLRAITDRIRVVPGGEPVHYPDFMFQYREAANFPWRSQAAWLYAQMVRWEGLPFSAQDAATAQGVFRPDLYRAALAGSGAPLPGASSKLEGALVEPIGAGSTQGRLVLGSDRFFDGRAFDPDDIPGYLAGLP
ncbi:MULTISPECIES: CmpA/NrtA family ABC transporter substrate-binding protein [unclassified Sphingomonas]|uniref:ABC transporter substrate-binding protein n=1 Tax=unclassified Sphingomonas TaxID=196159 RepID=UPI0028620E46|nr:MULTISPECIES: CmpA/NrtA family ABC transporter substrate-binding protein [unclassified Sphingomonas]MDR6113107.1 ABC-type nitrate/sulfonate/bicarbonate transport system substrate-binding protein [Sphingomonas sp. SORGH_AS_0789]MDR6149531.1 ABC-type nitrate/sulfonate/bicarbonate transport system substrate-binding protein [Sphingomonas sp. SORGH_AS_0742]